MGLLSIWDDWRKKQEGSWAARDDFSEMDSDLRPPEKIFMIIIGTKLKIMF